MAVQEDVIYKISRNGASLGVLQNVKSELSYNQVLNAPGCQLVITIGVSQDKTTQDIGDSALLQEGNDIEVVVVNDYYPNGLTKFKGSILDWEANFGGSEDTQITCLSYGEELDNRVIESGDTAYLSQTSENGYSVGAFDQDIGAPFSQAVIQVFTLAASKTVGSIDLMVSTSALGNAGVSIRQRAGANPDPANDSIIMSTTVTFGAGLTKSVEHVSFAGPSLLSNANTYYIMVTWFNFSTLTLHGTSANPYAGGSVWTVQDNTGTHYDAPVQVSGSDLYFVIYQKGGSTTAAYTSFDPSAIVTDIMNFYNDAGGTIQLPGNPITPLVSQTIGTTNMPLGSFGSGYAQSITPTSNLTVNVVQLLMACTSGTDFPTVQICQGNPDLDQVNVISGTMSYTFGGSNVSLGTANFRSITNTSTNTIGFGFSTPITLNSGTQYYILVTFGNGSSTNLVFKGGTTSDVAASPWGSAYYGLVTINNSSTGVDFHSSNPCFYVNLGYASPLPSSLDAGISSTGRSTDYTFRVNTVLEGIQKALQFSPQNWFWFVDMGTNILQFKAASTTADHTIIKGKQINELNLKRTRQYIKNVVYFSGGNDGSGSNVFVKRTTPTSLAQYKIGLDRISDNRATTTTQGAALAQDDLDRNPSPVYQTTIRIPAGTDDLDSYQLGQSVDFAGFGGVPDQVLLLIFGLNYTRELLTLTLGTIPHRTTKRIAELQRQLDKLQTYANPATPS